MAPWTFFCNGSQCSRTTDLKSDLNDLTCRNGCNIKVRKTTWLLHASECPSNTLERTESKRFLLFHFVCSQRVKLLLEELNQNGELSGHQCQIISTKLNNPWLWCLSFCSTGSTLTMLYRVIVGESDVLSLPQLLLLPWSINSSKLICRHG